MLPLLTLPPLPPLSPPHLDPNLNKSKPQQDQSIDVPLHHFHYEPLVRFTNSPIIILFLELKLSSGWMKIQHQHHISDHYCMWTSSIITSKTYTILGCNQCIAIMSCTTALKKTSSSITLYEFHHLWTKYLLPIIVHCITNGIYFKWANAIIGKKNKKLLLQNMYMDTYKWYPSARGCHWYKVWRESDVCSLTATRGKAISVSNTWQPYHNEATLLMHQVLPSGHGYNIWLQWYKDGWTRQIIKKQN